MPLEQLPQGTDNPDWVPPPPEGKPWDYARDTCIDYLQKSGVAQLHDPAKGPPPKDPWNPAAVGAWADALEDTDDPQFRWTIEAMRLVYRKGYRPYCATETFDRWCWFDVSKKIEEMEDPGSDVEPWLFALLKCGKLEVNFRFYASAIEAVDDMVSSLADWFASGRRLDDKDQPIPVKEDEEKKKAAAASPDDAGDAFGSAEDFPDDEA